MEIAEEFEERENFKKESVDTARICHGHQEQKDCQSQEEDHAPARPGEDRQKHHQVTKKRYVKEAVIAVGNFFESGIQIFEGYPRADSAGGRVRIIQMDIAGVNFRAWGMPRRVNDIARQEFLIGQGGREQGNPQRGKPEKKNHGVRTNEVKKSAGILFQLFCINNTGKEKIR